MCYIQHRELVVARLRLCGPSAAAAAVCCGFVGWATRSQQTQPCQTPRTQRRSRVKHPPKGAAAPKQTLL